MSKYGFVVALAILQPAWSQTQTCDSCRYGMVRLAAGQTMQLNVAGLPGQACSVMAGFNDSSGNPLITPVVITVPADQNQSVGLGKRQYEPVEIVPVVRAVAVGAAPAPLCPTDVEIIDTLSGFTRVLIPPGPQTQPPGPPVSPVPVRFPPVGLAWGQGIRLNVVAPLHPPQPCVATLSFLNAQGTQVGSSKAVTLAPGHADTLELGSVGLISFLSDRILLQPNVVMQSTSAAPSVCVPTVEVFDNFTLSDWIAQPPGPSTQQ